MFDECMRLMVEKCGRKVICPQKLGTQKLIKVQIKVRSILEVFFLRIASLD